MNDMPDSVLPGFAETLRRHQLQLDRLPSRILQVNVGKRCNQACHHCHVEAGPKRTEMMDARTAGRVLELLATAPQVHTCDVTGGAPELNPNFRRLVEGARTLGRTVIDRCNLTVLFEPGQENLAAFLAAQHVKLVASLPCYSKENVEKQRGLGVYDKSIQALLRLNALGYGVDGSSLELDLVYNPVGAFLPPPQAALETDYRRELQQRFGIVFNHLFTITNMPINRFLHQLRRDGEETHYMNTLLQAFNPAAALGVMCRDLISVSYDGSLYDCDFNQMLELPLGGVRRSVWDIEHLDQLQETAILFGDHCYGCSAGAGSSCGGALT